ncbi:MAG TPA: hypothetical protein VIP05_23155 [Burkholderiaceae bacterium]
MKRALALLLLACALGAASARTVVVYPRAETARDDRDRYPVQLLKLALQKAQVDVDLKPHPVFMLQVRALREVEQRSGLDVVWTMTSREREQALLPIRIPIDRGLLGWRLLLIDPAREPQFARLHALDELKTLRGGQGADWPDTTILRSAGLAIDESARYGDLFQKLAAGRIDYFPRSVQEIWGELDAHRQQGFVIEPTLALHYPAAMYFFVNKQRADLAADIRRGLDIALRDGSFDALFQQYFGDVLRRSRLGERQVFELRNPLLPPETPLQDARLWYRPQKR